jgi:hypothetical protein
VPVTPATVGSINRKITVQVCLGKKQDPISKITRAKMAAGVANVVECLPSKHKLLWIQTPVGSPPTKKVIFFIFKICYYF